MQDVDPQAPPPPYLDVMRPKPTGNVIAAFGRAEEAPQLRALERVMRRARSDQSIVAHAMTSLEIGALDLSRLEEPVLLRDFGIGLMPSSRAAVGEDARALGAEDDVEEARPEFYMYATGLPAADAPERTWGIAATGADESRFTGRGIRIAILDTGFDAGHPDFRGRTVVAQSFVAGLGTHDIRGHGTHCAGTACGPAADANRPRYGVAPEAELYVGKGLDDAGVGAELDIVAGMAWAMSERCQVISMSLGRPVQADERASVVYERIAAQALAAGCLVVAAAGNNSSRQFGFIAPVAAPANSPSVLAVAAVDPTGAVADFSCGAIGGDGGEIDLAGPGVDVFSAFPRPQVYRALSGTSMACPHAAGIAALWAESDPALRGRGLWDALAGSALALGGLRRDIGSGLVQAPAGGVA